MRLLEIEFAVQRWCERRSGGIGSEWVGLVFGTIETMDSGWNMCNKEETDDELQSAGG
jgi:hypothetical protein